MKSKHWIFTAFILFALVQWYIPAKMILEQEDILANGTEHKFRTAPIDPTDLFRGKYVSLRFANNTVKVDNIKEWTEGDAIYLSLTTDSEGFAKITSGSKEQPSDGQVYLKAEVDYVWGDGSKKLNINYPFDRYYMEESKAPEAERIYREVMRDSSKVAYALVKIKNGKASLSDVVLNGKSLKEIVE